MNIEAWEGRGQGASRAGLAHPERGIPSAPILRAATRCLPGCGAKLLGRAVPVLRTLVRAHLRLLRALAQTSEVLLRSAVSGVQSQDRLPLLGRFREPSEVGEGDTEVVAVVRVARIEPDRVS